MLFFTNVIKNGIENVIKNGIENVIENNNENNNEIKYPRTVLITLMNWSGLLSLPSYLK